MVKILGQIRTFIYSGHERSIKAKKNIALSLLLKPINIIIQLMLVPLLIGYLNPVKYGIWVTVFSVVNWFYFFDIGIGNGLRNKLAEALARNQKELANIYISTSYAALSLIVLLLYLTFLIADKLINWQIVFNSPSNLTEEINTLMLFIFTFFSINFVARLIGSIFNAEQKNWINDLFYTISNVLTLILVYLLTQISKGSLIFISLAIGLSTVVPSIVTTLIYFNKKYNKPKPSFSSIKLDQAQELTSLGFKFFIMQIAAIVVFTTDNLIISQLYGPAEVTPYNIAFKYFSIVTMGFSIIVAPFWSAFTDAYTKNEYSWIKIKIKQLIKIWIAASILVIIMLLSSSYIYKLWVGSTIVIPTELSLFMALFVVISTWNSIFTFFINGVGKVKLSIVTALVNIIINIPISILFAKNFGMGLSGIILGTCISLMISAVLRPIQYYKIMDGSDIGIWGQ